jgi:hypothetical protein
MAIESQGTSFEIETGSGTPETIVGITLGAVTKIEATAHALSKGDVVTFASIGGTVELNGLTAMVTATETNFFYVNIDSTGFGAYTTGGTATPNAFTAVGEVVDWDGPGGSASVIDTTHLKSEAREKLVGLMDEGQFTISMNLVPDDAGQQACKQARRDRARKAMRLTYSDESVQTWNGYVLGFSSSGGVDDKANGSITIEIDGPVSDV